MALDNTFYPESLKSSNFWRKKKMVPQKVCHSCWKLYSFDVLRLCVAEKRWQYEKMVWFSVNWNQINFESWFPEFMYIWQKSQKSEQLSIFEGRIFSIHNCDDVTWRRWLPIGPFHRSTINSWSGDEGKNRIFTNRCKVVNCQLSKSICCSRMSDSARLLPMMEGLIVW